MLRSVAARSISRSIRTSNGSRASSLSSFAGKNSKLIVHRHTQVASRLLSFSPIALTQNAFFSTNLVRLQEGDKSTDKTSGKTPPFGVLNQPDTKPNPPAGKPNITPEPEKVSTTSTTTPIMREPEGTAPNNAQGVGDIDMGAAIKGDLNTIKETFALYEVPRQAYVLGLSGLLPYLGTSLATVYCAWDINYAEAHGTGFILSESSAETLLHLLETLQIGYGAVIISFLGAIHWGLEWAGYGGYHGYRRYAIGVVAPAFAWPTLLMPVETALVTQFIGFTFLYYADSLATSRGWTPEWYGTYRFVLTFIVGVSIVLSLIGRGEIADRVKRLPSALDRIRSEDEGDAKRADYEGKKAKALGKNSS